MSGDLSDDTIVARIIGTAARHARRCILTETGHLAAVTEIAGLARGRGPALAPAGFRAAGSLTGKPAGAGQEFGVGLQAGHAVRGAVEAGVLGDDVTTGTG